MEKLLKNHFGHNSFKSYQLDVIQYILQGLDNLVIMPTGSGKSLCYQYSCLITKKITIVVSPLVSLMNQQVKYLLDCNIKSKYYDSNETSNIIHDILNYQIVYFTPEKMTSMIDRLELIKDYIGLFAIDECHCISEWGHDFRPTYMRLGNFKKLYPNIPVIAVTATATNEIEIDIITKLNLDISRTALTKTSIYRNNLKYIFRIKYDFEKDIDELYSKPEDKELPTIIYTNTVKNTEKISNYLIEKHNIKCINYYADIDVETKSEIHELFIENKIHCLVSTIAYGMGIHKDNIRRVVHYTPPSSIEQYCQQVGRAGRDNKLSECIMYYNSTDFSLLHNKNNLEKSKQMYNYCCTKDCRNLFLLRYFDENKVTIDDCNCDNCQPETNIKEIDLTYEVKNLLNVIYITGQIYGVGIIVDVLRGSKKKPIIDKNFDKIEWYGKGKYKSISWWKYIITLLQSKYCYLKTNNEYNNLVITNVGKQFLYVNNNNKILIKLNCNIK